MTTPSYANLAVIVVDDVQAMRAILRTLLRNLGIQNIVEAGDGTEALKILGEHRKDLVITDLSMAPMNGIELTRRLRLPGSLNAFAPVLMISAHSERSRISDAVAAGVSAFLLKPVTPAAFTEKLQALLEQPATAVRSPAYCGPDRRRRAIRVRKDRRSNLTFLT